MVEIQKIRNAFNQRFGGKGRLFAAPGRINLIGEHTDYNMGFVLPGAIDKAITVELRPNTNKEFRIVALDLNEEEVFTTATKKTRHHWASYVLGVVMEFERRCFAVPAFDAVFAGDVPQGGGMSSSAALESALAFAINEIGNFGLSRLEQAQIGQAAEHKYAGVRCGIMDQFTSLHGKKDHVILLDCRSLMHELVPFGLPGYCLVLLDTCVKHSLASSEYNTRRAECEAGVKILRERFPEIRSLRDASLMQLQECRALMPDNIHARCLYVIEENLRVLESVEHLKANDVHRFGARMFESHEGLRTLYEVSCAELDLLVAIARQSEGVAGGRMMGGGFGGCTINLVAETALADFLAIAKQRFTAAFGHPPIVHAVKIADGAREVA